MRLPRRVRLLDYEVAVKYVTRREYGDLYDGDPNADDGHFDRVQWTIFIVKGIGTKRTRWVFLHEYGHFLNDVIHAEKDR